MKACTTRGVSSRSCSSLRHSLPSGPSLSPSERLVDAVKRQDRAALDALLRQGIDVNARQGDGATALHWAVQLDDLVAAAALLKAGAERRGQERSWARRPCSSRPPTEVRQPSVCCFGAAPTPNATTSRTRNPADAGCQDRKPRGGDLAACRRRGRQRPGGSRAADRVDVGRRRSAFEGRAGARGARGQSQRAHRR